MNFIEVYALVTVTVASAYGHDEIDGRLEYEAEVYDSPRVIQLEQHYQICEPFSMKRKYCNNCFCFVDGSGWVCSTKKCTQASGGHLKPFTGSSSETDHSLRSKREIHAEPIQTIKLREDRNPSRSLFRSIRDNQICEPGSTKMKYCNTCTCTENGFGWFCTMNGCHERHPNQVEQPLRV